MPQIQLALSRPGKNHEELLFALQTRLSTSTTSNNSKERRGRRSSSTPANSMHGIVSVTKTTIQQKSVHSVDGGNAINRMSSNPSLQAKETNVIMTNGKENYSTSTNGSAREFLRKERRKRLF